MPDLKTPAQVAELLGRIEQALRGSLKHAIVLLPVSCGSPHFFGAKAGAIYYEHSPKWNVPDSLYSFPAEEFGEQFGMAGPFKVELEANVLSWVETAGDQYEGGPYTGRYEILTDEKLLKQVSSIVGSFLKEIGQMEADAAKILEEEKASARKIPPLGLMELLGNIEKIAGKTKEVGNQVILIRILRGDHDLFVGRRGNMVYWVYAETGGNPQDDLTNFSLIKSALPVLSRKTSYIGGKLEPRLYDPIRHRYKLFQLSGETAITRIYQVVSEFPFDAKYKRKPEIHAWSSCSICSVLKDQNYEMVKGGKLWTGGIPPSEGKLEILGAPTFSDSRSSRHWCIKRCPECDTHYLWEFDYEYLAGGTEDEVTLTRLSREEAERWVEEVNRIAKFGPRKNTG